MELKTKIRIENFGKSIESNYLFKDSLFSEKIVKDEPLDETYVDSVRKSAFLQTKAIFPVCLKQEPKDTFFEKNSDVECEFEAKDVKIEPLIKEETVEDIVTSSCENPKVPNTISLPPIAKDKKIKHSTITSATIASEISKLKRSY